MYYKNNKAFGFSLIELLITLSIIGILSGIAYPSYLNHLYKVRRIDGQIALLTLAFHLQQYYAEHQEYFGATLEGFKLSSLSLKQYYTVSISELKAHSYMLTATPTGSQFSDKCEKLTLNNTNEKGPRLECWQF